MNPIHPFRICLSRFLFGLLLFTSLAHSDSAQVKAWKNLKDAKVVALMRHAIAPGNGDPIEFKLGDCATQRNLSDEGTNQAKIIGSKLKAEGITEADIFSSQWCRCVDTATELGFGPPEELPLLNSFYQDRSTSEEQTKQLHAFIVNRLKSEPTNEHANRPAVLVTHQVNITALTGVFPSSGEIVFLTLNNKQLEVTTSVVVPH